MAGWSAAERYFNRARGAEDIGELEIDGPFQCWGSQAGSAKQGDSRHAVRFSSGLLDVHASEFDVEFIPIGCVFRAIAV
jgi:hypothetical protein